MGVPGRLSRTSGPVRPGRTYPTTLRDLSRCAKNRASINQNDEVCEIINLFQARPGDGSLAWNMPGFLKMGAEGRLFKEFALYIPFRSLRALKGWGVAVVRERVAGGSGKAVYAPGRSRIPPPVRRGGWASEAQRIRPRSGGRRYMVLVGPVLMKGVRVAALIKLNDCKGVLTPPLLHAGSAGRHTRHRQTGDLRSLL